MSRYDRHIILSEIGEEGQTKISKSKVLVVGAGGLGCPILQYLAAAGVGHIGIIDFDVVELSNLQRQVLFGSASLGKNKAIAAKERLQDLNCDISVTSYPEALTYQNALPVFKQYDIIVDGSDNFETRYLVNDACLIANKPLVFGAIYKFEGQVAVFNYKNGPSYRCLFPNAPQKDTVPNCSDIGVLGVLPGIIGSMQANEVLKLILNLGNLLSGKLLCYNALNNQISTLKIKKNNTVIHEVLESKNTFETQELRISCEKTQEVSIKNIIEKADIQVIDVRESHELPKVNEIPVISMPLSVFKNKFQFLNQEKGIYIFCQSGMRSKKAIQFLKNKGINNCYSIKENIAEIKNYVKKYSKAKANAK